MDDQNSQTPKDQNYQTVINELKQFKADGLSFEAAKEKLTSEGYSETVINQATDDFQYVAIKITDDEAQAKKVTDQVTSYYTDHPDQAVTAADNLLTAKRKEDLADARNQAILDAAAGAASHDLGFQGLDAQAEYDSKFAWDTGSSFWLIFISGTIIDVIAFFAASWLGGGWYYIINAVLSVGFFVYLIFRMK